jgi:hypothetical protein
MGNEPWGVAAVFKVPVGRKKVTLKKGRNLHSS